VISFVGAGPGAADLVTLRGAERLRHADVVIWAGSLVVSELLGFCPAGAVVHDSKAMTLDDVCAVYAAHPHAAIVRLHSGDASVFSAIGEQIAWCRAHDRAFEIVPGVGSLAAAAALASCELTIPGVAQSVVLTRLAAGTAAAMPAAETIEALAATGATMAIYLSVAQIDELARRLVTPPSAFGPDTPVVVVHHASWPDEELVRTTVGEMAAAVRRAGFRAATLFLVGPALAGADPSRPSHVYAPEYATRFRPASATGDG
jgi:precorrin-4/cobalt-precorrin-4 C11-methyltransferase